MEPQKKSEGVDPALLIPLAAIIGAVIVGTVSKEAVEAFLLLAFIGAIALVVFVIFFFGQMNELIGVLARIAAALEKNNEQKLEDKDTVDSDLEKKE